MKIYDSFEALIGKTPLIELSGYEKAVSSPARLLGKWEAKNPAGGAKDRVAREMLLDAEERGLLSPGGTVIEPTSGNTGIGLAALAAAKGYRAILTMPDTMSKERIGLLAAYGAEIHLTPGKDGMTGAIAKAEELHASIPGSILAGQFVNPANPDAHYKTTGPEIWADTDGKVDIFVATAGTGGTVTGTGRYLKEQDPEIRVVAVEPKSSAVLSGGAAGSHKIQGIGAGFVPEVLDTAVYDEVIAVSDEDAYAYGAALGKTEGFLAGISSGAALCAAVELAKRPENAGRTIVVLLPDGGDHYLSTPGYYD